MRQAARSRRSRCAGPSRAGGEGRGRDFRESGVFLRVMRFVLGGELRSLDQSRTSVSSARPPACRTHFGRHALFTEVLAWSWLSCSPMLLAPD
jgi:hypothetical protein